MSNTKELYTQYREAMRTHDDATAHRLLKQICAADPRDKAAAAQMQEIGLRLAAAFAPELDELVAANDADALRMKMQQMEEWAGEDELAKMPSYRQAADFLKGKGKKGGAANGGGRARTTQLYKQYREAGLAHDDEKAFAVLKKIVDIDPTDQSAVEQKRETGKRLCTAHLQELSGYLRGGNMEALPALVQSFREWGDNAYLNSLPDFPAAARLADAAAQREAAQKINGMFFTLQSDKGLGLREREEIATEIEQISVQHNVILDETKSECINQIHKLWQAELHRRSQIEKVNQGEEQVQAIEDDYNLHAPLSEPRLIEHLATLGQLEEKALLLADVAEGQPHFERIQTWKAKLTETLNGIRRRRATRQRITTACAIILLALGGTAYYAHSHADKIAVEMAASRANKDIPAVRDQLNPNPLLRFFCEKFSANYRIEFNDSEAWIKRYETLVKREEEVNENLRQRIGKITIASLKTDSKLLKSYFDIRDELRAKFNVNINLVHQRILDSVMENLGQLHNEAYIRFTSLPADISMEQLAAMHEEFKTCVDALGFNEEEAKNIITQFYVAANRILLHNGKSMTISEIATSKQMYNKYAGVMGLPASIMDALDARQEQSKGEMALASVLPHCTSLDSYVSKLMLHKAAYNGMGGVFPLDDFAVLQERLQSMACYQASVNMKLETSSLNYQKLNNLKSMFSSASNVYFTSERGVIPSYIDKLTLTEDKRAWQKELYSWVHDGTVHVGIVQKYSDGSRAILSIRPGGKKHTCTIIAASRQPVKLKLGTKLLEELGYVRMDLQKGKKLPVELLSNVANYDTRDCPVLLRAYLFGTTLDMMEHYPEPLASGIAFSPTLQADIEAYRSTSAKVPVTYGAWAYEHSEADEKEWQDFFVKVANHRYRDEIIKNLGGILAASLDFAGYVDEGGMARILPDARGKQIYYAQNGNANLQPYHPGNALPYTPLFTLNTGN